MGGEIELAVPPIRHSEQPDRSKLMAFCKGYTDVLDDLLLLMCTRGLSTREVAEAFRDPLMGELLLSRTAIGEITASLWEDSSVSACANCRSQRSNACFCRSREPAAAGPSQGSAAVRMGHLP